MTLMLQNTQASQRQTFYLDGQPITTKNVQQLHPRRNTVHRIELERGLFRHTIPPSVTTVIVKQQKDRWENELRLEKDTYEKLYELQGVVIPRLYGQGSFNGLPALILSDVAGITLYNLAHKTIEIQETTLETLESQLTDALKKLYKHSAKHWDQKLDNFLFCANTDCDKDDYDNGKVIIVDLEEVQFPDEIGHWETNVNLGGVGSLMSDFRDIKDRDRDPSPVSFWMTRPDDGGLSGTTVFSGLTQLMNRGNNEERKSTKLSTDAQKEGTLKAIPKRAPRKRKINAPKNLRSRQRKRAKGFRPLPQPT